MKPARVRSSPLLVALLVAAVVLAGPVGGQPATADQSSTPAQDDNQTEFAVTQGGECHQVEPIGRAWESVESFYGYETRSSRETTDFQDNQVSNLFVFHGTEGYSLVVLHDEYGDAPGGGTATMEFVGLPESGEWVIEDDNHEDRDDVFLHRDTRSKIDWKWIENRTDGAAFRGLDTTDDLDLTVTPRFNERADAWGEWDWSGDQANRTEAWRLYTDRSSTVELDMNRSITITKGVCDTSAPSAALAASSTSVATGESVTLDAGATADDTDVEYQWDLDGDGEADRTSDTGSITHEFESPGEYRVGVLVSDSNGNTNSSRLNVTVTDASTTTSGSDGIGGDAGDGDSTTEATTTTSSEGPGLGLLAGFVALLSTALLLGRRL
jgi:hypothetical protein